MESFWIKNKISVGRYFEKNIYEHLTPQISSASKRKSGITTQDRINKPEFFSKSKLA